MALESAKILLINVGIKAWSSFLWSIMFYGLSVGASWFIVSCNFGSLLESFHMFQYFFTNNSTTAVPYDTQIPYDIVRCVSLPLIYKSLPVIIGVYVLFWSYTAVLFDRLGDSALMIFVAFLLGLIISFILFWCIWLWLCVGLVRELSHCIK